MAELIPCPFCGGEAKISKIYTYGSVYGFVPFCKKCGCELNVYASKQAAINAWNRRAKERHGSWVYDPDGMDWNLGAWICSVCHTKNDNLGMGANINPYFFAGAKFCPQCGAQMDGDGGQT